MPDLKFCSMCLLYVQPLHNEATWVIEARTPDEEVVQRLLVCPMHIREVVDLMGDEEPQTAIGNFSVLRRYMPQSDDVLEFDEISVSVEGLVAGDLGDGWDEWGDDEDE
jgi:hypothetical protein